MIKTMLLAVLFSFSVPGCTDEAPDLVEDLQAGKSDGAYPTAPRGQYHFEPTLNGDAGSGEVLTLAVTPSGTFSATVSDEWQGTTSHHGTYKLYVTSDRSGRYIDLIEGSQRQRFEYSIDVVDYSTLWLKPASGRLYGLAHDGDDCTTAGCGAGETCTSCWGENVCMPAGTDC